MAGRARRGGAGEDSVRAGHLVAGGAEGLPVAPGWFDGVPAEGQERWLRDCAVPTVLVERSAAPGNPAAALDRVRTDRAHGAAVAVGHFARVERIDRLGRVGSA